MNGKGCHFLLWRSSDASTRGSVPSRRHVSESSREVGKRSATENDNDNDNNPLFHFLYVLVPTGFVLVGQIIIIIIIIISHHSGDERETAFFVPARFRASAAIQRRAATRFLCA